MPVISFHADEELMKIITDFQDKLEQKNPYLGRPSKSAAIRALLLEGTFVPEKRAKPK